MFQSQGHDYLILRDGSPYKLMCLDGERAVKFCRRLSALFPAHHWSVVDRFLPQGAD